jgi:hypothetical protein
MKFAFFPVYAELVEALSLSFVLPAKTPEVRGQPFDKLRVVGVGR